MELVGFCSGFVQIWPHGVLVPGLPGGSRVQVIIRCCPRPALGILTEAWQGPLHLLASTEQKIETGHWSTLVSSAIFVNLHCRVTSGPDFLKQLRNPPLHSEVNAFFGERASQITAPTCPHAAEALAVALW